MSEQWTDWRDHDGKGFPAELKVGMQYQTEALWGVGVIKNTGTKTIFRFNGKSWNWENYPEYTKVIRYRIRKPDALQQLITMVETLPAQKQLEVL